MLLDLTKKSPYHGSSCLVDMPRPSIAMQDGGPLIFPYPRCMYAGLTLLVFLLHLFIFTFIRCGKQLSLHAIKGSP